MFHQLCLRWESEILQAIKKEILGKKKKQQPISIIVGSYQNSSTSPIASSLNKLDLNFNIFHCTFICLGICASWICNQAHHCFKYTKLINQRQCCKENYIQEVLRKFNLFMKPGIISKKSCLHFFPILNLASRLTALISEVILR